VGVPGVRLGSRILHMKPFNDLSDTEQNPSSGDRSGENCLYQCSRVLHHYIGTTRYHYIGTTRSEVGLPSNGSAFIVKTSASLFGITAKQVYDPVAE
jgi:hypothetical protein